MATKGCHLKAINTKEPNLVATVSDLVNPTTGEWDKDLVTDIFWEEDAATILALPVHEGMDDIMAWHYDAKGGF